MRTPAILLAIPLATGCALGLTLGERAPESLAVCAAAAALVALIGAVGALTSDDDGLSLHLLPGGGRRLSSACRRERRAPHAHTSHLSTDGSRMPGRRAAPCSCRVCCARTRRSAPPACPSPSTCAHIEPCMSVRSGESRVCQTRGRCPAVRGWRPGAAADGAVAGRAYRARARDPARANRLPRSWRAR